jgi:hypothetical protein
MGLPDVALSVCFRNDFFFLPCSLCLEFENAVMLRMQEAVILAMNALMTITFPLSVTLFLFIV